MKIRQWVCQKNINKFGQFFSQYFFFNEWKGIHGNIYFNCPFCFQLPGGEVSNLVLFMLMFVGRHFSKSDSYRLVVGGWSLLHLVWKNKQKTWIQATSNFLFMNQFLDRAENCLYHLSLKTRAWTRSSTSST